MEIFYHGTYRLFDRFSLDHIGEGEGKSKFGQAMQLQPCMQPKPEKQTIQIHIMYILWKFRA